MDVRGDLNKCFCVYQRNIKISMRISLLAEGLRTQGQSQTALRLSAEGGADTQCSLILINLFTQPSPIARINIHVCKSEG